MEGGAGAIDAPPETEAEVEQEEKGDQGVPNTSEEYPPSEVFGGDKPTPQLDIEHYKKKGIHARKRKYEKPGKDGDAPVRDVVIFRYKMKHHLPGMSDDMEHWYEFWYFTRPNRKKDGDKYEQHLRAYNRGQKWIAQEEGIEIVGSSRKIIPYRRQAHS